MFTILSKLDCQEAAAAVDLNKFSRVLIIQWCKIIKFLRQNVAKQQEASQFKGDNTYS